jgi:hypothetical protein
MGASMANQVFTEMPIFTTCPRYTTNTCPHRKNTTIKFAETNAPKCFLLNDQTVEELNELCSNCQEKSHESASSVSKI